MDSNQEKIDGIFDRWFKGALTDSDWLELREMVDAPGFEKSLPEALKRQWAAIVDDASFTTEQRHNLAERILAEHPVKAPSRARTIPMFFRRFAKYAAAIILFIAVAAYFWNHSKERPTLVKIQDVIREDVRPGSNKAVLTLASGQQVQLDSVANGRLKEKGIDNDAALLSYKRAKEINTYNTLSTPRGGQYRLVLSDGTEVWLNAASSITYPVVFTEAIREVSVIGEVYFEVAKDKRRPFIVHAQKEQVEVLGTHFNINAYPDERFVKTSLIEGSVKVGNAILKPGQAYQRGEVSNTNIEQDIAWKNGVFNFQNRQFSEVMRQISRWYDIDVVFEKNIPNITVMGEMGRDLNLSEVLEILSNLKVHYLLEGKKLTVFSK